MGQMNFFGGFQPGAPALGTLGTGDLVRVLDACLNAGFTAQSVTGIARVGTTATVTKVAHGFLDQQRVTFAGANEADYNVAGARITVVDADHYSYQVANSPATPATGVITAQLTALGWGIAFTATNQRAYRAASGLRHYFMANDNSNTNTCIVRGFVSMSAVTTGTGPFPTVAQSSTNLKWPRPDPTTFTGVDWVVVGDDKRFFIGVNCSVPNARAWMGFGEFKSYKAADAYNTFIMGYANSAGDDTVGPNGGPIYSGDALHSNQGALQYYNNLMAIARAQDQATASILGGMMCPFPTSSYGFESAAATGAALGASSPISGGLELCHIDFTEPLSGNVWRRGRVPSLGCWNQPDFENNDKKVYKNITGWPDVIIFRGHHTDPGGGAIFPIGDWDTVFN